VFLVLKCFSELFSSYLLAKKALSYKKHVRKMLMKLTTIFAISLEKKHFLQSCAILAAPSVASFLIKKFNTKSLEIKVFEFFLFYITFAISGIIIMPEL